MSAPEHGPGVHLMLHFRDLCMFFHVHSPLRRTGRYRHNGNIGGYGRRREARGDANPAGGNGLKAHHEAKVFSETVDRTVVHKGDWS
jgi:hypothetical protein